MKKNKIPWSIYYEFTGRSTQKRDRDKKDREDIEKVIEYCIKGQKHKAGREMINQEWYLDFPNNPYPWATQVKKLSDTYPSYEDIRKIAKKKGLKII